ncbi:hypothetical protein [Streptomyces hainanensis]|uniref:Uncharacterized protein n=1 Tax=Streptomyces hainanensis TaxID=402648 RepID=A0A4R4SMQ3_9ACTN|nr:hypothetical protein [Streptomyces hainanensis]TDC62893.1 hypothetical protein E1283_33305 [Streptomyces hainanensis]
MSWAWEYAPDEETVAAGAPPVLVAEVEKRADELVRAAEALYLDGTTCQGGALRGGDAIVPNGMFVHLVVPRHERVSIRRITAW